MASGGVGGTTRIKSKEGVFSYCEDGPGCEKMRTFLLRGGPHELQRRNPGPGARPGIQERAEALPDYAAGRGPACLPNAGGGAATAGSAIP
jgi:hypothetical protein